MKASSRWITAFIAAFVFSHSSLITQASAQDKPSISDLFSSSEIETLTAAAAAEQDKFYSLLSDQSKIEYSLRLSGKDDGGVNGRCNKDLVLCNTRAHNAWVECRLNTNEWYKDQIEFCQSSFPGGNCLIDNPQQYDCLKNAREELARRMKECNDTKHGDKRGCLNEYRTCLGLPALPLIVPPPAATAAPAPIPASTPATLPSGVTGLPSGGESSSWEIFGNWSAPRDRNAP